MWRSDGRPMKISFCVIVKIHTLQTRAEATWHEFFDAKKEKNENFELGLQILLEYGIL